MLAFIAFAMAASPAGSFSAADLADARCFVVVSTIAKAQTDPTKMLQVQMGGTYFIGKIIGRNPATNIETLMRAVLPMPQATVATEAKRCGAEMTTLGSMMQNMGKSLTADGL